MGAKEVNAKKFDALMAKNITLEKCPKCREWGGRNYNTYDGIRL